MTINYKKKYLKYKQKYLQKKYGGVRKTPEETQSENKETIKICDADKPDNCNIMTVEKTKANNCDSINKNLENIKGDLGKLKETVTTAVKRFEKERPMPPLANPVTHDSFTQGPVAQGLQVSEDIELDKNGFNKKYDLPPQPYASVPPHRNIRPGTAGVGRHRIG